MQTFKKSDLHIIGHWKGMTQYEIKGDTTGLVIELSDRFYLSHSKNMYDYRDNLIDRLDKCYYNDYDKSYLGEEIKVID